MSKRIQMRGILFLQVLGLTVTCFATKTSRQFVNAYNGLCLEGDKAGQVYMIACDGGEIQEWMAENGSSIVNAGTGLCLESNAVGRVYGAECDSELNQDWDESRDGGFWHNSKTHRFLASYFGRAVYCRPFNAGTHQRWTTDRSMKFDNRRFSFHDVGTHVHGDRAFEN